MAYSNSPLVTWTELSPNHSGLRTHKIDTISIHCVVGQCDAVGIGNCFDEREEKCSSNYGVGFDGSIGMYVEEKNRSWCTSSSSNDNRAITIEVASDTYHPYKVKDAALKALIELCVDICKRNGIKELKWRGDKSLIGQVDKQNMTVHRWFANKSCPGDYLYNLHSYIAEEVNKRLKNPKGVEETMTEQELDKLIEKRVAVKIKEYFEKMAELPDFSEWSKEDMIRAIEMGITDGSRPHAFTTREECAVMAKRAAEYLANLG